MSSEFARYAVYWVPKRNDSLARFGACWTGWCAEHGENRSRGIFDAVTANIPAITKQVRCHGFHAAIKTPFQLGADRSYFSLENMLVKIAEDSVAFQLPRLRLAIVDGGVALVPDQSSTALDDLVACVSRALEPLDVGNSLAGETRAAAAPPSAIREPADTVIDFPARANHIFRVPLTDPIGADLATQVISELRPLLEPMLREPRQLHELALMGDPGEGRPLRVLQRYELRNWPSRKSSSAMPCHGPHLLVANLNDPRVKAEIAS